VTESQELPSSRASDVVERAAIAYRALADLAETVEDEWQYVVDLADAYLPSLRALAGSDPGRSLPPETVAGVDEAIAEAALIEDPHRAIDWLSTFPHVVALALGGDVDRPPDAGPAGPRPDQPDEDDELDGPDEGSPFGILLRGGR
jgi:hypothetical protein